MKKSNFKYLIGIDEVGRGPLAGPVAVGAFLFLKPEKEIKKMFKGVKESKQLSEKKREEWYKKICDIAGSDSGEKVSDIVFDFEVVFQSEKVIDKKGISFAIKNALAKSLENLIRRNPEIDPEKFPADTLVLLDGGLKAPAEFLHQKTIIKGDAKETVIALASICAKVQRDRKMRTLAKKYPKYGFDVHKGYGTSIHRKAILEFGLLSLHRRSFCKNLAKNLNMG